jgi:hypothetical protein
VLRDMESRAGRETLLFAPGDTPGLCRVGVSGTGGPSSVPLSLPLFSRRPPPWKVNPPVVILFGNFGQLP